ncbi:hypothetical protein HAX54_021865 [Datura stramonium]|uniref:Uncharacterized protein n=1 Tax=Datura stramonium TaxID=4076 RepID=A0ABS8UVR9_DATST|nr:hypothetical protein [Datura stramonium]
MTRLGFSLDGGSKGKSRKEFPLRHPPIHTFWIFILKRRPSDGSLSRGTTFVRFTQTNDVLPSPYDRKIPDFLYPTPEEGMLPSKMILVFATTMKLSIQPSSWSSLVLERMAIMCRPDKVKTYP